MTTTETPIFQGTFFAVSIQEHKILGTTFTAHILKLLSSEAGIYSVRDNVFPENFDKWREFIPEKGKEIIKLIGESSDSNLLKVFGKGKMTVAKLYEKIEADEVFGEHLLSYHERRLHKCFSLIISSNIPTFTREKKIKNVYHENLLTLNPNVAKPVFNFTVTPTETHYSLCASYGGVEITLKDRDTQIICNKPGIIRLENHIYHFDGIDAKKLKPFFTKDYVIIPKSSEKKYFETFVLNAVRNHIVKAEGFNITNEHQASQAILSLEPKLNGQLGLILYFKYGTKKYPSHSKPQIEVKLETANNRYHFKKFGRNFEWEDELKNRCIALGLNNIEGSEYNAINVETDHDLIEWINNNEREIIDGGFTLEQLVQGAKYYLKQRSLDLTAKLQNDWFDVYGLVKLKDFEFPFIMLRKNILKGIREYILPNGEVFVIPEEWLNKYKPLFLVGKADEDKLTLSRSSFGFIQQAEVECSDSTNLIKRFEQVELPSQLSIPKGLKAQLRGYQKLGYIWMQLLNECSLGGCLADDMGLGKTVQTLTVLLHEAENNGHKPDNPWQNGIAQMGRTSLLVVPTSLIFNWQREIAKFTPSLSVYQFTGPDRTRAISTLINHDIVLTTYGVLRNDIDLLKDVRFNYVVLDESQTIKNPTSKVYRSAMLIKAKHYLSLSGTPIENSLTDLWAQLNFLNRGMLGSLRTFKEEFILPIEKGNEQVQKDLQRIVQPFILRRSKEEVAPELPELNEQVLFCNLSDEQKSVYEKEKSAIRNQIIESIEDQGYGQSAISILRGLTRLRQIANHPKMLDDYPSVDSGKFNEVVRTIESITEENHKVLIFSSFVKHLRIIEDHLAERGVNYQMLIGSTTNRQQKVDAFQNNPSVQVFLISIKAGGVGLNLTAADYILILDPWWNPAVENQAIARAHRIGQDKKVFVYRFIAVDTVEEKIQRLQESKLLLSDNFVNNTNPLSVIDEEQIMEIMS